MALRPFVLLCACVHVSVCVCMCAVRPSLLAACCPKVLQACVGCMDAVANKVTHNYKLVADCFQKFYGKCVSFKFAVTLGQAVSSYSSMCVCQNMQRACTHYSMYPHADLLYPVFLERVRLLHSRDQQSPQLASQRSLLLRSLFVVSLMCRHFDFDQVSTEEPLPDLVSGCAEGQHQQLRVCIHVYV